MPVRSPQHICHREALSGNNNTQFARARFSVQFDSPIASPLGCSSNSSFSVTTMGSDAHTTTEGESDDSDGGRSPRVEPKIEEVDDGRMRDISDVKSSDESTASEEKTVVLTRRRGRGRPKKVPSLPSPNLNKVAKGRSKTGCLTCRRRKKKCDEGKPECEFAMILATLGTGS